MARAHIDATEVAAHAPGTVAVRRVLVVDDNPGDVGLVRIAAARAWEHTDVQTAGTLAEARRMLTIAQPECILLDLSLPDAQGLEGVSTLGGSSSDFAIVVLTGRAQDDLVLSALAEGAQDYLTKDELTPELLRTTVDRAIERRAAVRRLNAIGRVASAVLNTIDSPTVALDVAGTIVASNEAWNRVAPDGGPDAAAGRVGSNYLETFDRATGGWSPEASEIAAGIRSVLSGDAERFVTEYPCVVRGAKRWYSLRVVPLGELGAGAVVTHTDMTETRLAEEAMRFSGQTLRALVADAAPIFLLVDADARINHISQHTEERFGLDATPMLGMSAWKLVHPADVDRATAALDAVAATPGEREMVRVRVRGHEGRWLWVGLTLTNLLDHPAVAAIVVTGDDVTEARQEAVTSHLDATLLDRLPAALLVTDEVGIVVYWNRRATELFGYAAHDAMGRDVLTLIGPEEPAAKQVIRRRLGSADRSEGEITLRSATGEPVPVIATIDSIQVPEIGFEGVVGTFIDNADRKRLEMSLVERALHDQLTDLPNRGLFLDRLSQALARTLRGDNQVAVLFIDLDHFKLVNDSAGHAAGDELLRAIAMLLEGALRPTDTIARIGGDEFAVCCEDLHSADEAWEIAHRFSAMLSQPFVVGGQEVYVGMSIGIAMTTGAPGETPESLLRDADVAMYKAKALGRGRFEMFDESLRQAAARRAQLSTDLHRAIENHELRLSYQPVVDLASGAVVGAEALVRWQHPTLGLLYPDDFLKMAEDTGLIVDLSEWVLTTAVKAAERWRALLPERQLTVAVNVSARYVLGPTIHSTVASLLEQHNIEPAALCLEITETTLMSDAEAAVHALRRLKVLGVAIAIDDFGTGYSSLAYLKQFPVDHLKLDRTFVADMLTSPDDLVIVRAMIDLAESLGLGVIAEGVEVEPQRAELAASGCALAQGFLWSPGVDEETFLGIVADHESSGHVSPERHRPARTASAASDDVLAALTHEAATPLTVLGGMLELLAQTTEGSDRERVAIAMRSSARLANLVGSLGDARDLEAGTLSVRPAEADLRDIVRRTIEQFSLTAPDRVVVTPGDGEAMWITTDPPRIEQILTNLLSNADKYSPAGEPITVIVDADARDDTARVLVADRGPGVPPERVADVFRKFAQLDLHSKGLGLGLYLSRKLARALGGDVTYVSSAPGVGATFALRIPREIGAA